MRPRLAPVPTAIVAESPAALMLTVAVPAAKLQLTAACDGDAAAKAVTKAATMTIVRFRTTMPGGAGFGGARESL
jgi:hypothetical protein